MGEAKIIRDQEIQQLIQERVDSLLLERKGKVPFGVWSNNPRNAEYIAKYGSDASLTKYHNETFPMLRKVCQEIANGVVKQIQKRIPIVVYHDKLTENDYPASQMLETVIEFLQAKV